MPRETKKQREARLALEEQEATEAEEQEESGLEFSEGDSLLIDLNDIEDSEFELMPRGKYPCVIIECEFAISQNGGNPMWSMVVEVEEGDFAERKLFMHWVWAGKGVPYTKKQAARIAPELFEQAFDPQDEEYIQSMVGKRLSARISDRKYEGERRNNIADVFAPDGEGGFLA